MSNLYELVKEIETFTFEVDEETGEITNMDALDALELERDTKIENIALWIKNLNADEKALKEEADKLRKRAQMASNQAERLKEWVGLALHGEKFSTSRCAISYRKSEGVVITNLEELPAEYTKTKVEPDKIAIKKTIKGGQAVPGAELEERVSTVIK